jgi:hypothetical protein
MTTTQAKLILIALAAGVVALVTGSAIWSARRAQSRLAETARAYEAEILRRDGLLVAERATARELEAQLKASRAAATIAAARAKAPKGTRPIAAIAVGGAVAAHAAAPMPPATPEAIGRPCLVHEGEEIKLGLDGAVLRAPAGSWVLTGDLSASVRGVEIARAPVVDGSIAVNEAGAAPAPSRASWLLGTAASLGSDGRTLYGATVARQWQVGPVLVQPQISITARAGAVVGAAGLLVGW